MRRCQDRVTVKLDGKAIGRRIAEARTRRGWSRTDLAGALGVRPGTVSNYEGGWRIPRLETVAVLAVVLRRTMDWITTGRGARSSHGCERDRLGRGAVKAR